MKIQIKNVPIISNLAYDKQRIIVLDETWLRLWTQKYGYKGFANIL